MRDLIGQRFGRLTALRATGERRSRQVVWHCRCDCGREVDVMTSSLTMGHAQWFSRNGVYGQRRLFTIAGD